MSTQTIGQNLLENISQDISKIKNEHARVYFERSLASCNSKLNKTAIMQSWVAIKNVLFAKANSAVSRSTPQNKKRFFWIKDDEALERDDYEDKLIMLLSDLHILSNEQKKVLEHLKKIKNKFVYAKFIDGKILTATEKETTDYIFSAIKFCEMQESV